MSVVNIPTTASGYYENIVSQARQAQRAVNRMQMAPKLNASGIIQPLGRIIGSASEFQKSMDASAARVFAFGAAVGVINGISDAFKGLIVSAAEVEKSLKDIQVVMEVTDSAMQKFGKGLFDVARNTASGFQAVAESATELARQGLSAEETLARVNSALILSRLSGLDTVKSTETLTAAINSFNKEGITHTEIVNRMANVDAAFAVSSADLAEAVSRAGAVAQSSGVSFNELASVITAVQQRTARGGSVIGNGFKSIFTRIKRSRVRETLQEIGVATQDNNGNFRSSMAVLKDYADVYKTLSDEQKSYTSEQIAGVYQIQNLQALIQDLNSEYSVYNKALSVANNTTNEATMRNEELNKTLSAVFQQTSLSAKELASSIGQIGLSGNFKEILTFLNTLAKNLNDFLSEDKGSEVAKSLVRGIGNFLTGPGMVILGAAFVKIFGLVIKFAREAFADVLGLNKETKRQQSLQAAITQILTTNSGVYQKILAAGANTAKQEQIILNIIRQETAERLKQEALIKRIASGSRLAGIGASETGFVPMGTRASRGKGKRALGMASGFLPSFMKETLDISKGVGGARSGDRPVRKKIKTTPGKTSDVIAHTGEWIVKNYNNSGADAIFNRDMAKTIGLPSGAKKINAAGGIIPNFGKRMTVKSNAAGISKRGIISKDADPFDSFTGTFNIERLAKKSKEYGSRANRWITGTTNPDGVINPNQIKSKESNAWIFRQTDPRTGKDSYALKGGAKGIKRKMEKIFWPGVTNEGQGKNAFTTIRNITQESWKTGQKVPKLITQRFGNLTKSLKGLQAERLSYGKLKARNEDPKYTTKNNDFDIMAKGGLYEVKSSKNQSMVGVLAKAVRSFLKKRRLNEEPILRGNGRTDNVNVNNTFGQDSLNLITASDTKILDKGIIKTERFKRKVFEEDYSPNVFANASSKIPKYASGFIPNFIDRRSRGQKIKDVLSDPANKGIRFKGSMMGTKNFSTVKKGMGGEFQKMWIDSYLKHGRTGDYQMLMKMGYNPDELLKLKKHFERGGKVNIKTLSTGLVPNFAPRWKRFSGKYNSDKYLKNLKNKQKSNQEMNEAGYIKAAEGSQKFQRFNDKFGLEKIDDFLQIFPFFSRGYVPKQGLGVKRSFAWKPDGRKDWYTQFAGKSSEMQNFMKWAEANKKLPPSQLKKLKGVVTKDSQAYEKGYWEDYNNIKSGNASRAATRGFYGTSATSSRALPGEEKMRINITDPQNKLFIKQDKMNELIGQWKRSQAGMGFARGFMPNFGKGLTTSRGPITAQQITRLKSGQHVNNKQTGEKLYLNKFTLADQAAIKKYEADNSKRVMAQRQQDSKAAKNQLKTIDASRQATMLVATKNLKQKVDSTIQSNGEKVRLKYRVEGIKNSRLKDQETELRRKSEEFMLKQAHLTSMRLAGTGQFAANTSMPTKVANAGSIGSAAGSIFETAIQSLGKNKLFTKNNATFDIQGFPDNNLKKLFGYYSPFADAKIGITPGTKTDFNQKLLKLPQIQQKITGKQRREQGKIGRKTKGAAGGYIPNFSKLTAKTKEVRIGSQRFPLLTEDYDGYKNMSNDIGKRFKANSQALMDGLSGKIPMDNDQIKEIDKTLKKLKKEQRDLNLLYRGKSRGISLSMLKNLPKGMKRNVLKYGRRGKRLAMGYLPNFNKKAVSVENVSNSSNGYTSNYNDPLMQALSREKSALKERGIAGNAIRLDSSPSLKGPMNPRGLAVTNTVDEPMGVEQGIKRSKSMGINPKTHGAVPNFALPLLLPLAKGAMHLATALPLLTKVVSKTTKTLGGAAKRGGGKLFNGMGEMDNFSMALMMGGSFIQEGIRGGRSDDELGGGRGLATDVVGAATMGSLLGKRGALVGAGYGAIKGLSNWGGREESSKTFEKIIKQKKELDSAMKDGEAIQKFAQGITQLNDAVKSGDYESIVQAEGAIYDAMNSASDTKLIESLTMLKGSSMTAEEKLLTLNKEMGKLAAEAERLAASVTLRENLSTEESTQDTSEASSWDTGWAMTKSFAQDVWSLNWDGAGARAQDAGDRAGLESMDAYATKEGRLKADKSADVIVSEVRKQAKQRVEQMTPDYISGGQARLNLNEEAKRTQHLMNLLEQRSGSNDQEERRNLSREMLDTDFQFSAMRDKSSNILDLDIDDMEKWKLLKKELDAFSMAADQAGKLLGKTHAELSELAKTDLNVRQVQEVVKSLLISDETERQANMIKSKDRTEIMQSDVMKSFNKIDSTLADGVVDSLLDSKSFGKKVSNALIKEQDRTSNISQGFVTTVQDKQKPVDDRSKQMEAAYRNMIKRQKTAQESLEQFSQATQLSTMRLDAWVENMSTSLNFLGSTGAVSEEEARKRMDQANLSAFDNKNELAMTQQALSILAGGIDFGNLFDKSEFSSKKPTGMTQELNYKLQQEDFSQNSQLANMYEQFMKDTNNNPTLEEIKKFAEKISHVNEKGNEIAKEINQSTKHATEVAKIQREKMIHKMKIAEGEAAFQRIMSVGSSAITPGGRQSLVTAIGHYGSGPMQDGSGVVIGRSGEDEDNGILTKLNRFMAGQEIAGITGVPEHILAGTTQADLAFAKGLANLELAIREAQKQGNQYLAEKFQDAVERLKEDKKIYDEVVKYINTTTGLPEGFSMDPMEQVSFQIAKITRDGLNLHQHTIDALGGFTRQDDYEDNGEGGNGTENPNPTKQETKTETGYYNDENGVVRFDPTQSPTNDQYIPPESRTEPGGQSEGFSKVVSSIQVLSASINSLVEPLNSLKTLPTELKTQLEAIIFNFAIEGEMKITLNTEEINAVVDDSILAAVKEGLIEPVILNAITNRVKEELNTKGILDK